MNIISCYSFKGGTGRTTSTANLATALAMQGKNVLTMDLDIEGPGLSVVLHKEDPDAPAIQDYLMHEAPEKYDYHQMMVDIKKVPIPNKGLEPWEDVSGNLYLIPARIGVERSTIVEYKEDRIHRLLENLFDKLEEDKDLALDYLLIDSENGYSEMSAVSIAISRLLLVFFRWSRQHVLGTIKIAQFFKYLVGEREFKLEYEFIANCVPRVDSEERNVFLSRVRKYLEQQVGKELFGVLPENEDMKWNEQLIMFDDEEKNQELVSGFKDLAKNVISKFEE